LTWIPLTESGETLGPLQIILDAEERFAYVTCFDSGEVRIVDTQLEQMVQVIDIGGKPWLEDLTPDGRFIYIGNWGKDGVDIIDTGAKTLHMTLTNAGRPAPVFARPHGVAITDDGRYVFVTSENTNGAAPPHHGGTGNNGRVTVIEVATNRVLKSLEVEVDPTGVAFIGN
jgi:DNA-binding beta-propeller fold protein YncE